MVCGRWRFGTKKNKTLILSRDHFGQKPLYYYHNSKVFAFSSELSSLSQHSLVNLKINPLHLARFLLMDYIPAPNSLYQDIHKVMPGEFLTLKDGIVTKKRFWKLSLTARNTHKNEPENIDRFTGKSSPKNSSIRCPPRRFPLGRNRFLHGVFNRCKINQFCRYFQYWFS